MTDTESTRPQDSRWTFPLLVGIVLVIAIGSFAVLLKFEPPEALIPPQLFVTIAFDVMLALLLTYAVIIVARIFVRGKLYSLKLQQQHTSERHRASDTPCLGVMVVDKLQTKSTKAATNRALKDIPYVCHKIFSNQRPAPQEMESLQECLDLASLVVVIGEEREANLPQWAHDWVAGPAGGPEKKIAYFLHVKPTSLRPRFLTSVVHHDGFVFSSAHELEEKLRELVGQNAISRFRDYRSSMPAVARR